MHVKIPPIFVLCVFFCVVKLMWQYAGVMIALDRTVFIECYMENLSRLPKDYRHFFRQFRRRDEYDIYNYTMGHDQHLAFSLIYWISFIRIHRINWNEWMRKHQNINKNIVVLKSFRSTQNGQTISPIWYDHTRVANTAQKKSCFDELSKQNQSAELVSAWTPTNAEKYQIISI